MSTATTHYRQHAISIKLCSEKIEECDVLYKDLIRNRMYAMAERVLNIKKEWLDILTYHATEVNKRVIEKVLEPGFSTCTDENKSVTRENLIREDHEIAVYNKLS